MFRIPKFYHADMREIEQFLDENGIDYLESGVFTAALNAASRGPLGVVVEPTKLELVLTVGDKISPALERFSVQCGGPEIALKFFYKVGAAVKVSALSFACH